jgi:predicted PhzF superfamily epimerase YddE/YHI9
MRIKIFQVDAFAEKLFEGNPAAVCPLERWLPDGVMQKIAAENNLSETAFYAKEQGRFRIRWFTPKAEVKLCGHATLASAHVLFNHEGHPGDEVEFDSLSGPLKVRRRGDLLELDFPSRTPVPCAAPPELLRAFKVESAECLATDDYHLVFRTEREVREAKPDFGLLKGLDLRGVGITAPGDRHDFVSRFFAPKFGIDEDPVTGSAHTKLTPFWAARLGKTELRARQVSERGGELLCRLAGDRVLIAGKALLFFEGMLTAELPGA